MGARAVMELLAAILEALALVGSGEPFRVDDPLVMWALDVLNSLRA